MRALFGIVSLLLVLAIVGIVAKRQLQAVSTPIAASAAPGNAVLVGTTPHEQSQNAQQQVKDDIAKAMDQAAAVRKEAEDK